ncbi:hypothetical protein THAOC_07422 [Thalassiosira oceanica]|uniref:Uncharacterized protein n=1 Tax=Thalassiosira oceanica TaxID=159749 RepID=K0T1Z0_THAOC|nr:hypothetical protein THAOC_07422 [Thalassiosira oceanica]|eukprot:EJK71164.1 hypothetical protein THAOC_07422 [Thalassiosira oceanica]
MSDQVAWGELDWLGGTEAALRLRGALKITLPLVPHAWHPTAAPAPLAPALPKLSRSKEQVMELSIDDFLRGLVRRIDALEEARSSLASKVEALQFDNECLKRESTDRVADLKRETDRVAEGLRQKIDGLARENAILREEIAGLKRRVDGREVHISSFLGAKGIAYLGRTCRHFGMGRVSTDGQMTSLVEELAGQVVDGSASDYEKSVLVGGRKVKMLHKLELMRSPLYFGQLIGHVDAIRYSQPEDKSKITFPALRGFRRATAISNQEMKAGRHYVTFHMTEDKKGLQDFDPLCYDSDQHKYRELLLADKTDEWGDDLHCCSYSSSEGTCFFANWNDEDKGEDDNWAGDIWEGMEHSRVVDNLALGLLLDLDAGTLSVLKGGRKLGVMKEGLTGSYCWYVHRSDDAAAGVNSSMSTFDVAIRLSMEARG